LAILLFLPSRDARLGARINAELGRRHRLVAAGSWSAVPALVEREPVHGVVVDASTSAQLPFGELGWLRRQHPAMATIVVLDPHGHELELFRLGRLGVDGVVFVGNPDLERSLRDAVERGLSRGTARRVVARLDGRVPTELVALLSWAVEHAHLGPDTADLAGSTDRSRRSLQRTLRRADLPTPSRILLWGRLLSAAHLLDRDQVSVDRVAHYLGYAAGSSLARALRRETGLPPSEIRSRGGIQCVLDALLSGPDLPSRPGRGSVSGGGPRPIRLAFGRPSA
jgi:AraC-like DNA-binding protein